jgi:drug/metabolite transporter (DMT)-like permease
VWGVSTEKKASWVPAFAALSVIWGSSFLFIKIGVEQVAPLYVTLFRTATGALVLLVTLAVTRDRLPRDARLWGHLTLVAFVSNVLPFTLFAYAEDGRVSSVVAGIWNATTPLGTLILMIAVFPQERATRERVGGLLLGFFGVLVVLGVWQGTGGSSLAGQLICFAAAMCYAVNLTYVRRFIAGRSESGTSIAAAQITLAAAQLAVIAPLLAGAPANPLHLHLRVAAAIVALGALGTGFAFVLLYRVIRLAGAQTSSTVTYVMPIVATVAGVAVLGEKLHWYEPVGALVILLGVAVTQDRLRLPRRRTATVGGSPAAAEVRGEPAYVDTRDEPVDGEREVVGCRAGASPLVADGPGD